MKTERIKRWILAVAAGLSLTVAGAAQETTEQTKTYELNSSQLVADFAREHGLAAEHVAWANGIAPVARVSDGRDLKVPNRLLPRSTPEDGAVVNLAERGAYLFNEGEFQGFYPISIGQNGNPSYHTPTGEYEVISRIENPTWKAPESDWAEAMEKDRIDADSPDNPLGEYWFGIGRGYGFHENVNPDYTGDDVSHGCMRMYPEHAKQIYNEKLLTVGDKVTIVNQPIRLSGLDSDEPMIAVFPPIYGTSNEPSAIRRRLEAFGIVGMVSEEKLAELSRKASGIPTELLGTEVTVRTPRGQAEGLLQDGSVLMPTSAVRHLGLDVEYDGESDELTVSDNGRERTFPIDGTSAHRWKDKTYLGARDLLSAFSLPFTWDGESKALAVGEASDD